MKVGKEYLLIKSLVNMHDVVSGNCYIVVLMGDNIGDFFTINTNKYTVIDRLKVTKTP